MTETMKAMVTMGHGDIDQLVWQEDWPKPQPDSGQVLIRVAACGLNNTDVNTRSGWYSKSVTGATTGGNYSEVGGDDDEAWGGAALTFPRIQGADACGYVESVGYGVDPGLIGERVITDNWLRDWDDPMNMAKARYFGSEVDGGFAEFAVTDARNIGVVSSNLRDTELATFSCSYSTAEGMLNRANVAEDDRVLITGASGGVGSALIQLANRRGAMTIAMASSPKHDAVREIGPTTVIDRAPDDLAQTLEDSIGYRDVTVVADIVGGTYFPTIIDVLARGGRYTCSGAIAGPIVELDLRTFYLRDLTFTGSTIIPPHVFQDLVRYIENGELKPLVAQTYPLRELRAAQTAFIEKRHVGNIVVVP